jgi:hypothetical protein
MLNADFFPAELSSFFSPISKHTDAHVTSCHNFKNSVAVEIGLVRFYSSWTAISSLSLLWNWRSTKCGCCSDPYSMVGNFPVKQLLYLLVLTWCLGLYCCAEGSPLARDRSFGPLKQHSNEGVEITVCEWFRMQEPFLTEFLKLCWDRD